MLEIVASHHCIEFQGKLMIQIQKNYGPFGPNLSPLGPNTGRKFFLPKSGFTRH